MTLTVRTLGAHASKRELDVAKMKLTLKIEAQNTSSPQMAAALYSDCDVRRKDRFASFKRPRYSAPTREYFGQIDGEFRNRQSQK